MVNRLIFFFILTLFAQLSIAQQRTTIYLVRHAEKDLSVTGNPDPALSGDGLQRSFDLRDKLGKEKIEAIFSTRYKRTEQTGAPLAQLIGKEIIPYDATSNQELVKKISESYKGKSVLVVGHSNTVLSIAKAFGATPATQEIKDDQYNLLFRIIIEGEKLTYTELTYGR